ncbi:DUF2147 domain-containing protein [Sphingobium aromaticiconvertens]|uniref:DUF2147 domain-containing protein n=1 Tax=Sphingobium aromaticiconvertens TaxID=365341 RepID=UPI003015D5A0
MRLLSAAFALAMLFSAVPTVATDPTIGQWINPRGSVVVTTGACSDKLCGWVSWASSKALADAREGGVPKLLGTELLQDYRETKTNHWSGRVYVPDMGKTYYSTIEQLDADRLKISGCILGGWICRSQIWRRQ